MPSNPSPGDSVAGEGSAADAVHDWVQAHESELIAIRRDLHAHPEIGHDEHRTTAIIVAHLEQLGLAPRVFPSGTGVLCDIGTDAGASSPERVVALRADIDALPIVDVKDVPYRSQNLGLCHACGHDVHTTALLGAASALVAAGDLGGRVRLIFQPAEEQLPGGAVEALRIGAVEGVQAAYTLHCDPRLDLGLIGLRVGPITAACDTVEVHLSGPGGHTARPQLTADVVYALGRVITEVPGMLSRRVDPRAGLSLVWGAVSAGVAGNAIPESGVLKGTVRMLQREVWDDAEKIISDLVVDAVAGTGARVQVNYERGVPPVVNDAAAVDVQRQAVLATLGPAGLTSTEQSMGGEDFGWLLGGCPGALARLGVRDPEHSGAAHDLHQGGFDVDERAIAIGAEFLAQIAVQTLR